MSLSNLTELAYHGFQFPPETHTEEMRVTPVYDAAGRTVVYSEFFLRVVSYITPDSVPFSGVGKVGTKMERIRRTLQKPGGKLVVRSLGFGDLDVNTAVRDVAWGPKPGPARLENLGSGNAVRLTWEVSFALPDCAAASTAAGTVLEYNYRLAFGINDGGQTTRTYTGHLVVAQTRASQGSRAVTTSADRFRADVVPLQIPGFRRVSQQFDLSEDRRRLEFTVVDVQMGRNFPPPGVTKAKAGHRRGNQTGQMGQWFETIDATYTLAPGTNPQVAADAFFKLLKDRIDYTRQKVESVGKEFGVFPVAYSDGEPDLYADEPTYSFSAQFRVTCPLQSILEASSLWRPVPNSNWNLWAASMPFGPRGSAKLIFNPGDDRIEDACQGVAVLKNPKSVPILPLPAPLFSSITGPGATATFMHYVCGTRTEVENGVVSLKTLPEKAADVRLSSFPEAGASPGSGGRASDNGAAAIGGGIFAAATAADPVYNFFNPPPAPPKPPAKPPANVNTPKAEAKVQKRVTDTVVVFLFGQAVRVGLPIPEPRLVSVNGVKVTPASRRDRGEGFTQAVVGNVGVPVFAARWLLRYVCELTPVGGVGVPGNPIQGA